MQKVAIFQHADGEWIGSMRHWFADKPFQLTTYRLDQNVQLPAVTEFDWLIIMGGQSISKCSTGDRLVFRQ